MLIIAVIAFLSLSRVNPIPSKTSSSSLLTSRAVPEDQLCGEDGQWDGRFCDLANGVFAWIDRCLDQEGHPFFPKGASCGAGEHCFERVDIDGHDIIDCVLAPRTPDGKDVVSTKTQLGKRKFNKLYTPKLERIVSVELQQDIPSASVSGHVILLTKADDTLS